jgi:hypothetical protein
MPHGDEFTHRLRGLAALEFGDPDLLLPMLETSYEKDPFILSEQELAERDQRVHPVPTILSKHGTILAGSIPEAMHLNLSGEKGFPDETDVLVTTWAHDTVKPLVRSNLPKDVEAHCIRRSKGPSFQLRTSKKQGREACTIAHPLRYIEYLRSLSRFAEPIWPFGTGPQDGTKFVSWVPHLLWPPLYNLEAPEGYLRTALRDDAAVLRDMAYTRERILRTETELLFLQYRRALSRVTSVQTQLAESRAECEGLRSQLQGAKFPYQPRCAGASHVLLENLREEAASTELPLEAQCALLRKVLSQMDYELGHSRALLGIQETKMVNMRKYIRYLFDEFRKVAPLSYTLTPYSGLTSNKLRRGPHDGREDGEAIEDRLEIAEAMVYGDLPFEDTLASLRNAIAQFSRELHEAKRTPPELTDGIDRLIDLLSSIRTPDDMGLAGAPQPPMGGDPTPLQTNALAAEASIPGPSAVVSPPTPLKLPTVHPPPTPGGEDSGEASTLTSRESMSSRVPSSAAVLAPALLDSLTERIAEYKSLQASARSEEEITKLGEKVTLLQTELDQLSATSSTTEVRLQESQLLLLRVRYLADRWAPVAKMHFDSVIAMTPTDLASSMVEPPTLERLLDVTHPLVGESPEPQA